MGDILPTLPPPDLTAASARLTATLARLEVSARFLEAPVFMAQINEAVALAVIRAQSDWADRVDAAAYAGNCSLRALDDAAERGIITRVYQGTRPVFPSGPLMKPCALGAGFRARRKARPGLLPGRRAAAGYVSKRASVV